jgi:predicted DsbA family dithiol-disulfide isomerase
MRIVEVFADVACPFTHVGLRRITDWRGGHGATEPRLRVRAWPLELVNGEALRGRSLALRVAALRADVAPDLFRGFDRDRFPFSSLLAMASESAAYRQGPAVGERFSLAVRTALFEEGLDIADAGVLRAIRDGLGVQDPTLDDEAAVYDDYEEGKRRGVAGSPHFFTADGDFFCPSLDIEHRDGDLEIAFDAEGFSRFIAAAFP